MIMVLYLAPRDCIHIISVVQSCILLGRIKQLFSVPLINRFSLRWIPSISICKWQDEGKQLMSSPLGFQRRHHSETYFSLNICSFKQGFILSLASKSTCRCPRTLRHLRFVHCFVIAKLITSNHHPYPLHASGNRQELKCNVGDLHAV